MSDKSAPRRMKRDRSPLIRPWLTPRSDEGVLYPVFEAKFQPFPWQGAAASYFCFLGSAARRRASASAPPPEAGSGRRGGSGIPGRAPPAGRAGRAPVSSSSRSVSAMRLRGLVDLQHLHPHDVAGLHHLARVLHEACRLIAETWTRPSWCTPISTKAPKAATLVTDALQHHAGLEVVERLDALLEGRGLEGRARVAAGLLQFAQDVGHGRQAEAGRRRSSAAAAPAAPPRRRSAPARSRFGRRRGCGAPPDRLPGCTPEASSGSSPSAMRRKPAHCSKAFGPEPRHLAAAPCGTRNGPLASRWATMFWARPGAEARDARQQRRRGRVDVDADRVDAVLDHARRASATACASSRSCWYWPTPIDFGSILTSSASGSCSRRAIDTAPRSVTSSSGQFLATRRPRRNRPRRRPPTPRPWSSLRSRQRPEQVGGEPVGLARGGAVADGDQLDPVLGGELGRASPSASSQRRCGSCG